MTANVYINKIDVRTRELNNTTGVIIHQYDFVVLAGFACIAMKQVAIGGKGPFLIAEGVEFQAIGADALKAGEDTFNTQGDEVFYDPATGKLSDVATVGYYAVGKLVTIKDANGMIIVHKYRFADPVLSDET